MDTRDYQVQHYREMADEDYFDRGKSSIYDVPYGDLEICEMCRYDFEEKTGRTSGEYCDSPRCINFTCEFARKDCETCGAYEEGGCMGIKNCGGLKKWTD